MKFTKTKILILAISILLFLIFGIQFYLEYKNELLIKNATINIKFKEDLNVPFNTSIKLSDLILELNGKITDDFYIDTTKLGKKKVSFEYLNEEKLIIPYSFFINIVDITPPIIWLGSSYTVYTDFKGDLNKDIMCADDSDNSPNCIIEGEYDTTKAGTYKLNYIATDKSGNVKNWPFTLYVKERKKSSGNNSVKNVNFEDAIKNYKNKNTKLGIDVSFWQGDIDFEKVKNAGVEFAMIRVGSKKGSGGEYFVDSKFVQNITGFNDVDIPVGVYFYSYAKNKKEAKEDALWVVEQIKNYKVDLPVVFDWEDWSNYNNYNLSLFNLTENAKTFLKTVEKHGYTAMHYSSKSYLDGIWYETGYPVWLAHYTKKTDYLKEHIMWQFSCTGKVDGIDGDVDLNVMYTNESSDINE